jgi:hypothetical protein
MLSSASVREIPPPHPSLVVFLVLDGAQLIPGAKETRFVVECFASSLDLLASSMMTSSFAL